MLYVICNLAYYSFCQLDTDVLWVHESCELPSKMPDTEKKQGRTPRRQRSRERIRLTCEGEDCDTWDNEQHRLG